jgi:AcrR family transcriptional regulator
MTAESPSRPDESLRSRARDAIRAEVVDRAWLLFAEHGYAATTIEQIAHAAGMSPRTFFRYFSGKDELVTARLLASGDQLAISLAARPAGECPWRALHRALAELASAVEEHPDVARRLYQMLEHEPEVRAATSERVYHWLRLLQPLVAARLPDGDPGERQLRARAITGSALACFDAAQQVWAAQPEARLGPLLDDAMRAVAPLE